MVPGIFTSSFTQLMHYTAELTLKDLLGSTTGFYGEVDGDGRKTEGFEMIKE